MYHRIQSIFDKKGEEKVPNDLLKIPVSFFANNQRASLEFDVYSQTGALLFKKGTPFKDAAITKCIVNKSNLFRKKPDPTSPPERVTTKIPALLSEKQLHDLTQETAKVFSEIEKSGAINKSTFNNSKRKFESLLNFLQQKDLSYTSLYLSTEMSKLEDYVYQHAINTGILAMVFGMKLGIPENQLINLIQAAYYFDVGFNRVPIHIIRKKDTLTSRERQIIQAHPRLGYALLHEFSKESPEDMGIINAKLTALLHHKKYNGSGYPYKKDFEALEFNFNINYKAIPQFSKMTSICEMFTALDADRPWRKKIQRAKILKKILNETRLSFDIRLVHSFINKMGLMLNDHKPFFKVGDFFLVQSEFHRKHGVTVNHEIGICHGINTDFLMSPQLLMVYNIEAKRKLNMIRIDLTKDPDRKIIKIIESQKKLDMLKAKLA